MESVTERIIDAKDLARETLGVSDAEIIEQIIGFYNNYDNKGMNKLFLAYLDWELKGLELGAVDGSREETIKRATDNFGFHAQIADVYAINPENGLEYAARECLQQECVGPITEFYRESLRKNKL